MTSGRTGTAAVVLSAAVLAAMLTLVACAAPKRATGTFAPVMPDPCAILTAAEVTALTGEPVAGSMPAGGPGGCTWSDRSGGQIMSISTTATTPARFTAGAEGYQRVEGIGDDAYLAGTVLYVRHGDIEISIIAGDLAQKSAIARKLISKL